MIGIYKITNIINNHCYIGQSIDIQTRWRHHKNYPLKCSHYPLYKAFDKYGLNSFTFEILEECNQEELNEKEKYYIKLFDSYKNGYNQTEGGESSGYIIKISNENLEIIYDLLQNSSISQKEIANMFQVGEDTISEINQGKTRIKQEYQYPLRINWHKNHCIDCGKEICSGAIRCINCYNKYQRKVERPDREQLKQKIRTQSFLSIGKEYGVSDNTIRKWCQSYFLPYKKKEIAQISDFDWILI